MPVFASKYYIDITVKLVSGSKLIKKNNSIISIKHILTRLIIVNLMNAWSVNSRY